MTAHALRILLVNTLDQEGGAEQVAHSLLTGYRARGHEAWLAVGVKRTANPHVLPIDHTRTGSLWARFWWNMQAKATRLHGRTRWGEKARRALALMAAPQSILETLQGYENSHFPGTYRLLELPPDSPQILHCHSLQRGYFELEALPMLSRATPTVLTLHDAWLLSGHCTHSFDCNRWQTGCGNCPDLEIPPRLLRDGTARNWQRKRAVFQKSRLWIAVDSRWLLGKLQASPFSYQEARVIYPGIDLNTFRPGDRAQARAELGLPRGARILMFVAHNARRNPWKDFPLLRQMLARVRAASEQEVILLVAGETVDNSRTDSRVDPDRSPGNAINQKAAGEEGIWFAPRDSRDSQLAKFYRAADIYVHATKVETFGLTIAEAMASGLPVVATNIASVPELVKDGETGFLTAPGDAEAMAARVLALLNQPHLAASMGRAAAHMSQQFNVEHTVDSYLAWYQEILAHCA